MKVDDFWTFGRSFVCRAAVDPDESRDDDR
jgi:hypothetical protein